MRNRIVFILVAVVIASTLLVFMIFRFRGNKSIETQEVAANSAPTEKPESLQTLLARVKTLEINSDSIGLKNTYQKLINDFSNHKDVSVWQKKLDQANIKIIFSPQVVPVVSQEYEIKPLDTLAKIAKDFNTTVELLKKSNNLSTDKINPGRKLKVWIGKFSVLVDKSQNTLILKSNEEIIKTYNVATGLNNSTPVGIFKIVNKLTNPTWYKSGAIVPAGSSENILGTRWLGFDIQGYGIHGTTDPSSIGKQATAGCVRMLNNEVEELYSLLPVGTVVTVAD